MQTINMLKGIYVLFWMRPSALQKCTHLFSHYKFPHSFAISEYYWSFSQGNCWKISNYGMHLLFIDFWWSEASFHLFIGHWISMNYLLMFLVCFSISILFSSFLLKSIRALYVISIWLCLLCFVFVFEMPKIF